MRATRGLPLLLVGLLVPAFGCAQDGARGSASEALGFTGADLTIFGMQLGEATLPSTQRELGPAGVVELGDAAAWRAEVCYRSVDGEGKPVLVVFRSNSMASRAQGVTSFAVVPLSALRKPERCADLRGKPGVAITGGGIGIGARVKDVEARLGRASVRDSRLEIIRVTKMSAAGTSPSGSSKAQEWDVTTSLVGTIGDGRLVEFEVSKIISN